MAAAIEIDIGGIVSGVADGLDSLFTSDEEREAANLKLQQVLSQPHILQAMANIESAKNTNWFVAGGRPALFWVCALSLLYHWLVKQFIIIAFILALDAARAKEVIELLPSINSAEVTGLVAALLGLASVRGYEKVKGVAREK
jgi:hypothetical protein